MSAASRSVGNAELGKMREILQSQHGTESPLAFLWAGFDTGERRRLCLLSGVAVTVGQGANTTERFIDDWFDFAQYERDKLAAGLRSLYRLHQRAERVRGQQNG